MTARPFRFVAGPGDARDRTALVERACQAEALGYDAMLFSDHLLPQLAPLPAMVAAAEATRRLRVGAFVLNNDLRHPAVLAQELATVDQLTGGRLEIGIGAGWNRPEYDAAGLSFDAPGTRVGRMEEAIHVLKGLLGGGPFSFEGRHYRIAGMEGWQTVQRPHPPLIVGGGGRRVMRIAGREAQIVSVAPRIGASGPPEVTDCLAAGTLEKVAWAREAAPDRFGEVEVMTYTPLLPVTITADPRPVLRGVVDRIRERFGVDVTEEELLDSPHVFAGTVDGLVEKCLALRERFGISAVNVSSQVEAFAPVVARLAGR
jgi:probable F420-dependent oxidoreductase